MTPRVIINESTRSEENMFYKICFVFIVIISAFLLSGCTGRNNRERITQYFNDNEELLNRAIDEILNLDAYVRSIAHTRSLRRDDIDFEGLYIRGTADGWNVIQPLENQILNELFENGRIRSISIRREDLFLGTTYQIQFAFRVRSFGDRYEGIYFSINDEPISFTGHIWENPQPKGEGWVSYGRHFYFTERIAPNWFYYEMLFNSSRTP